MYLLVTCQFSTLLAQITSMAERALVAKKLGRYDITRVLGKGAMGVVYEARDPNLNRKVAIKTVRVDSLSTEEAADYELRFRTEAHSAARLQHPNIVSVYDSDRDGDTPFLVMEFVKGEDLKHYLDAGQRYTLEQSVRMMRDLLAALDYAHQSKIIHRDIKPANLLIEANGRVKLTDFGVARIQDSGEATRTQGGMVGTLKYMSPEQVEGLSVDAASDMFSAGIVLYQLLTDRRPFDGDSYFSIVNQIANINPPAPSSINPMLPTALDAVVARALAKDKTQRFATAQDFSLALQAAARRADPTITPSANPYKIIDAHGTGSMGQSGSSASARLNNTNSTVTQELELVYWKDVKDSDDLQDLEGFLIRFPEGVYADLAKRRLKRIADVKVAQGHSVYETTQVAAPSAKAPVEVVKATVEVTKDVTITLASPAPEQPSPKAEDTNLFSASVFEPLADPTIPLEAPSPEIPKVSVSPVVLSKASPAVAPMRSKNKNGWLLGAVAAVVASVTAWTWMGTSAGSNPEITATGAAPAQNESVSAVLPNTLAHQTTTIASASTASLASANSPTAPAAASTASTPTASASAARSARLTVTATAKISPKPGLPAPKTTSTPVQRDTPFNSAHTKTGSSSSHTHEPAVSATANPPVTSTASDRARDSATAGPKEACDGRILFAYGACLIEQCARPVYQKHPVCVERRLQEEQRKEQSERR
jgi:eukaryotic-like serine/threonine-protein kinase